MAAAGPSSYTSQQNSRRANRANRANTSHAHGESFGRASRLAGSRADCATATAAAAAPTESATQAVVGSRPRCVGSTSAMAAAKAAKVKTVKAVTKGIMGEEVSGGPTEASRARGKSREASGGRGAGGGAGGVMEGDESCRDGGREAGQPPAQGIDGPQQRVGARQGGMAVEQVAQVFFRFIQGSSGMDERLQAVVLEKPFAQSFDEVGGHGLGGPPQLPAGFAAFVVGQTQAQGVRLHSQLVRQAVHFQITIAAPARRPVLALLDEPFLTFLPRRPPRLASGRSTTRPSHRQPRPAASEGRRQKAELNAEAQRSRRNAEAGKGQGSWCRVSMRASSRRVEV